MTEQEKQEIISAVLSAIRTNSKTIAQLTPVSEMSDDDYLELSGGRKVSYGVLFAKYISKEAANNALQELAQMIEDSTGGMSASFVGSKLVITGSAAPVPQVNVGALSNNAIACRAGQTAIATFQVSGKRLEGNIDIALSNSTKFSLSATSLTPNNGTVPLTTITVTYTPGANAAVGTSHLTDIVVTYDDETIETLSLTGTVAAAPSIQLTPSTLNISAESGQESYGTIHLKGIALEGKVILELRNTSYMSFEHALRITSKEISKDDAETGINVPVYYTGAAIDSGTIAATSTGATEVTADVIGAIAQRLNEGETIEQDGMTFTVLADTTKVSVKATSTSLSGNVVIPSSVHDSQGFSYSVVKIEQYAFRNCTQITSISIPDTVTAIEGYWAFNGCTNLSEVNLGNGVTSLGTSTFYGCAALESIVIPDQVTNYGSQLFENCISLKTIQIGTSSNCQCTTLGGALKFAAKQAGGSGNNNLETIICYAATPPSFGLWDTGYGYGLPEGFFGSVDNPGPGIVKVPSDKIADYQGSSVDGKTLWSKTIVQAISAPAKIRSVKASTDVVDKVEVNGTAKPIGALGEHVKFDGTGSGMAATDVQSAIDELAARPQGGGSGTYAPFAGKKMAVIGDSFTAMGAGSTGWFDVMCRILGATMQRSTAVSGGAWHGQDSLSAYQQAQNLVAAVGNNHPDYILIVMGVNDINNDSDFYRFKNPDAVDLGNIVYTNQHDGNELSRFDLTTSPYSFTAGVQATLTYLKRHFPNAIIKIGWTPSGMQFMANGFLYPGENKDPWQIFHSYVQRLKDLADMYGVDYINTLHCGISWWLTEDWENYMVSNQNNHPNEDARQRIGEYMARLMLGNL